MTAFLPAELAGTYTIDASHSRLGFVARHAMVTKVRGSFNEFTGTGVLDPTDPGRSRVELVIQAASIDTRNADRDAHLRSNDFFNMAEFPELRFASTSVTPRDDTHFTLTGDLTIKGVTNSVDIDVEYTGAATDPFGNRRIGFEGTTVVNRKDWGVNWNAALEAGGLLVSEHVTIEVEISAIADQAG